MSSSVPVPLHLATRIALRKAKSLWGDQVPSGPYLPCAGEDGGTVAYMFTFAVGVSAFPSHQEILAGIADGRRIAVGGFEALGDSDRKLLLRRLGRAATDRILLDRSARRLGAQRALGAGHFGTVAVSATFDRAPLPLYADHLPPYFTAGDVALSKAESILGARAELERIYLLDHAQYFELSASGARLLLNANNLAREEPEQVLARRRPPCAEAKAQIATAWKRATQDP